MKGREWERARGERDREEETLFFSEGELLLEISHRPITKDRPQQTRKPTAYTHTKGHAASSPQTAYQTFTPQSIHHWIHIHDTPWRTPLYTCVMKACYIYLAATEGHSNIPTKYAIFVRWKSLKLRGKHFIAMFHTHSGNYAIHVVDAGFWLKMNVLCHLKTQNTRAVDFWKLSMTLKVLLLQEMN